MRSLLFLDVMQRWVVVIYQHYITIPVQQGHVHCGRSLKSGITDLNVHQWLKKNRSHMHLYNLQFGTWQWKDSTGPKFVNLDVQYFDLLWSPNVSWCFITNLYSWLWSIRTRPCGWPVSFLHCPAMVDITQLSLSLISAAFTFCWMTCYSSIV
jgi:hypothetical protein